MKETLKGEYMHLGVESFDLHEDVSSASCRIHCVLKNPVSDTVTSIDGTGVGMVDAFFRGFREHLVNDFPSLNTISFAEFEVKAILGTRGGPSGTDAEASVEVWVRNSYGRKFRFESRSRSIGTACLDATLSAMEYFVNSERTFCILYQALQHYRKEGRTDLESKYTDLLSQIVENTSYSEVIENMKHDLEL